MVRREERDGRIPLRLPPVGARIGLDPGDDAVAFGSPEVIPRIAREGAFRFFEEDFGKHEVPVERVQILIAPERCEETTSESSEGALCSPKDEFEPRPERPSPSGVGWEGCDRCLPRL